VVKLAKKISFNEQNSLRDVHYYVNHVSYNPNHKELIIHGFMDLEDAYGEKV
jgi:hypothetical protein